MQFRLRHQAHDIELPPGEFVIGRSEDCQLALDDPMVSRRHATLRVSSIGVIAVDLGSRNGVTVNGEKIKSERRLQDGDRVGIGGHELVFVVAKGEVSRQKRLATQTLGPLDVQTIRSAVDTPTAGTPATGVPRLANALNTLATLADKALALGRVDEAERLLANVLTDLLRETRKGMPIDPAVLDRAAGYSLKLALGLSKASWIDWVLEVYLHGSRMAPAATVDQLCEAARKVRGTKLDLLSEYIEMLQQASTSSPNERFQLQRLEGLRSQLGS